MMKFSVFLVEISCFRGRRNEKQGQNVDGRNIHKFRRNIHKFRRNFGKKRNIGNFLKKKSPPIGKVWRNFLLFWFISAIFHRFFENIGTLHLLLIRRLPTSPHWSKLVHFSQLISTFKLISTFFKSWMN